MCGCAASDAVARDAKSLGEHFCLAMKSDLFSARKYIYLRCILDLLSNERGVKVGGAVGCAYYLYVSPT